MALTQKLQRIQQKPLQDLKLEDLCYSFRTIDRNLSRGTDGYHPDQDIEQLKRALQAAITLEFATIPPYLCALWSIVDDVHPVAQSIREIVQEEMLHMALVCNLLVSIGGVPQINAPHAMPSYPGQLPFGVHPGLTVGLSGLTDDALDIFIEIERPLHPSYSLSLNAEAELLKDQVAAFDHQHTGPDKTIGEFYDAILASFKRNADRLIISTDRQITGPLAWRVIQNLEDVEWAIELIKRQGEGSEGPVNVEDPAHYYRFAEIRERKKLVRNPVTCEVEFGETLEFPTVWPMAVVPKDGYQQLDVAPDVWQLLHGFDCTYSHLLDLLQSVWQADGGQAAFWHAIDWMFELEQYARPLMEKSIPGAEGSYGPCFRYLLKDDR